MVVGKPLKVTNHLLLTIQDPLQIKLGSNYICKMVRGHQKIVEVEEFFTYSTAKCITGNASKCHDLPRGT